MGRPRKGVPTYRLHKQSGHAIVTVYDRAGKPRDVLLGAYDSPQSRAEYARVLARLAPGNVLDELRSFGATVEDVIADYWEHAKNYYRDQDGKPTSELQQIKYSLRPLRKLFASLPAETMTAKHLAQAREELVRAKNSRNVVNARVNRMRRAFRWALAEGIIPAAVVESLRALAPLKVGRTAAPECEPVKPVSERDYLETLKHLPATPRTILELMRLTGARPGEVIRMSWNEISDQGNGVWKYELQRHKNAYRGKRRAILLGPRAQSILTAYCQRGSIGGSDPIFCSRRDKLAQRTRCKTPGPNARKRKPKKRKGAPRVVAIGYRRDSLRGAVERAADLAGVAHWHPNQLRHLVATEVRSRFGLDGAQATLGHATPDMTLHYAELNDKKASEIAGEIG